jgi:hypothetical protein
MTRAEDLPQGVERKLDALLSGWAERQALSPARVEAIRRSALAPAQGELDLEWWTCFLAGFRANLQRSLTAWQPGLRSVAHAA